MKEPAMHFTAYDLVGCDVAVYFCIGVTWNRRNRETPVSSATKCSILCTSVTLPASSTGTSISYILANCPCWFAFHQQLQQHTFILWYVLSHGLLWRAQQVKGGAHHAFEWLWNSSSECRITYSQKWYHALRLRYDSCIFAATLIKVGGHEQQIDPCERGVHHLVPNATVSSSAMKH